MNRDPSIWSGPRCLIANGYIKLTPRVAFVLWDAAGEKHPTQDDQQNLMYRLKLSIKERRSRSWNYVERGPNDGGTVLLLRLCTAALSGGHWPPNSRATRTAVRAIQCELLRFLDVVTRISTLSGKRT